MLVGYLFFFFWTWLIGVERPSPPWVVPFPRFESWIVYEKTRKPRTRHVDSFCSLLWMGCDWLLQVPGTHFPAVMDCSLGLWAETNPFSPLCSGVFYHSNRKETRLTIHFGQVTWSPRPPFIKWEGSTCLTGLLGGMVCEERCGTGHRPYHILPLITDALWGPASHGFPPLQVQPAAAGKHSKQSCVCTEPHFSPCHCFLNNTAISIAFSPCLGLWAI